MSKHAFPLRLSNEERERARNLAKQLGISENRLYNDVIHDGLLIREQMLYMTQLRKLASSTSKEEALAILDRAADVEPEAADTR